MAVRKLTEVLQVNVHEEYQSPEKNIYVHFADPVKILKSTPPLV